MTQMPPSVRARSGAAALATLALALPLAVVVTNADPALAARQKRKVAKNLTLVLATPLGLQGTAGAGGRTVLPLRLTDRTRRRVDVEVEFGMDRNGDGVIADGTVPGLPSEYRAASHRRHDPRDTARVKQTPAGAQVVTFRPSRAGASHAFVWDAEADLGRDRVLDGAQIVRDETGRVVRDPFDGTQPRFTEPLPGVVLRARATRRGGQRERTEWTYTAPFSVDNSNAPSASVDAIAAIDAEQGLVEIDWTAFDADSEDTNGNGVLDVLDLEDRDGDGRLDQAPVAVAFDHYRLADGERVPAGTLELAALDWAPCTHAEGLGDPDVGLPTAPEGVGRAATFVWDVRADRGVPELAAGRYLVRAIPYDSVGNVGDAAYFTQPIVIE